jgi:enoyl-CoA hydratase
VIEQSYVDGVTVLRLGYGKASALDLELVMDLTQRLAELARTGIHGVVLTGTGSIFSAGVDLFKLVEGGRDYIMRFLPEMNRMFEALFLFPAPVVAAVNGHAIAGGCILACCCDRRLMADGGAQIGLPELKVGVPFPPLVVEIMRSAVPVPYFNELLYVGRTYAPADALARGVVDDVVPAARLLARAQETASELAATPPASFRLTKRAMRLPYVERAKQAMAEDGGALMAAWTSEETGRAIRAYVKTRLGR